MQEHEVPLDLPEVWSEYAQVALRIHSPSDGKLRFDVEIRNIARSLRLRLHFDENSTSLVSSWLRIYRVGGERVPLYSSVPGPQRLMPNYVLMPGESMAFQFQAEIDYPVLHFSRGTFILPERTVQFQFHIQGAVSNIVTWTFP